MVPSRVEDQTVLHEVRGFGATFPIPHLVSTYSCTETPNIEPDSPDLDVVIVPPPHVFMAGDSRVNAIEYATPTAGKDKIPPPAHDA